MECLRQSGEAYSAKGDKDLAVKNYKKAFDMVADAQNKKRIKRILDHLGK